MCSGLTTTAEVWKEHEHGWDDNTPPLKVLEERHGSKRRNESSGSTGKDHWRRRVEIYKEIEGRLELCVEDEIFIGEMEVELKLHKNLAKHNKALRDQRKSREAISS